jgi:hypothetical protein
VTAGTASAPSSHDMNAAFMSFQPHESGIHAVWPGAGEVRGTEVCFRCALRAVARRERTTILKLTENTLWMVLSWLMPYFTPQFGHAASLGNR